MVIETSPSFQPPLSLVKWVNSQINPVSFFWPGSFLRLFSWMLCSLNNNIYVGSHNYDDSIMGRVSLLAVICPASNTKTEREISSRAQFTTIHRFGNQGLISTNIGSVGTHFCPSSFHRLASPVFSPFESCWRIIPHSFDESPSLKSAGFCEQWWPVRRDLPSSHKQDPPAKKQDNLEELPTFKRE